MTAEKKQRFRREKFYLYQRHLAIFNNGDPYYNPNLPLDRENFGLRFRLLRPFAFILRDEWQKNHSLVRALGVLGKQLLQRLARHV